MGTDRLVVRSAPSPARTGGSRRLRSIPRSCIAPRAAGEPWSRGSCGELGPVSIPTRALPAPLVRSPVCGPVSAALPRPLSPPCQCPPFPAQAAQGEARSGRERPGLPARSSGAAPLLEPCRATPVPAGVTCGNPWMNSGLGDPALPPEEQRAWINWLTDFCHI